MPSIKDWQDSMREVGGWDEAVNHRNIPLIRRPRNPQVNSAVSAVFSVADPQVRTFRTCLPACADSADSELRMCGYTEADNVRISSEYGGYSDRFCASNMSYIICAVFERLLLILCCE